MSFWSIFCYLEEEKHEWEFSGLIWAHNLRYLIAEIMRTELSTENLVVFEAGSDNHR